MIPLSWYLLGVSLFAAQVLATMHVQLYMTYSDGGRVRSVSNTIDLDDGWEQSILDHVDYWSGNRFRATMLNTGRLRVSNVVQRATREEATADLNEATRVLRSHVGRVRRSIGLHPLSPTRSTVMPAGSLTDSAGVAAVTPVQLFMQWHTRGEPTRVVSETVDVDADWGARVQEHVQYWSEGRMRPHMQPNGRLRIQNTSIKSTLEEAQADLAYIKHVLAVHVGTVRKRFTARSHIAEPGITPQADSVVLTMTYSTGRGGHSSVSRTVSLADGTKDVIIANMRSWSGNEFDAYRDHLGRAVVHNVGVLSSEQEARTMLQRAANTLSAHFDPRGKRSSDGTVRQRGIHSHRSEPEITPQADTVLLTMAYRTRRNTQLSVSRSFNLADGSKDIILANMQEWSGGQFAAHTDSRGRVVVTHSGTFRSEGEARAKLQTAMNTLSAHFDLRRKRSSSAAGPQAMTQIRLVMNYHIGNGQTAFVTNTISVESSELQHLKDNIYSWSNRRFHPVTLPNGNVEIQNVVPKPNRAEAVTDLNVALVTVGTHVHASLKRSLPEVNAVDTNPAASTEDAVDDSPGLDLLASGNDFEASAAPVSVIDTASGYSVQTVDLFKRVSEHVISPHALSSVRLVMQYRDTAGGPLRYYSGGHNVEAGWNQHIIDNILVWSGGSLQAIYFRGTLRVMNTVVRPSQAEAITDFNNAVHWLDTHVPGTIRKRSETTESGHHKHTFHPTALTRVRVWMQYREGGWGPLRVFQNQISIDSSYEAAVISDMGAWSGGRFYAYRSGSMLEITSHATADNNREAVANYNAAIGYLTSHVGNIRQKRALAARSDGGGGIEPMARVSVQLLMQFRTPSNRYVITSVSQTVYMSEEQSDTLAINVGAWSNDRFRATTRHDGVLRIMNEIRDTRAEAEADLAAAQALVAARIRRRRKRADSAHDVQGNEALLAISDGLQSGPAIFEVKDDESHPVHSQPLYLEAQDSEADNNGDAHPFATEPAQLYMRYETNAGTLAVTKTVQIAAGWYDSVVQHVDYWSGNKFRAAVQSNGRLRVMNTVIRGTRAEAEADLAEAEHTLAVHCGRVRKRDEVLEDGVPSAMATTESGGDAQPLATEPAQLFMRFYKDGGVNQVTRTVQIEAGWYNSVVQHVDYWSGNRFRGVIQLNGRLRVMNTVIRDTREEAEADVDEAEHVLAVHCGTVRKRLEPSDGASELEVIPESPEVVPLATVPVQLYMRFRPERGGISAVSRTVHIEAGWEGRVVEHVQYWSGGRYRAFEQMTGRLRVTNTDIADTREEADGQLDDAAHTLAVHCGTVRKRAEALDGESIAAFAEPDDGADSEAFGFPEQVEVSMHETNDVAAPMATVPCQLYMRYNSFGGGLQAVSRTVQIEAGWEGRVLEHMLYWSGNEFRALELMNGMLRVTNSSPADTRDEAQRQLNSAAHTLPVHVGTVR